MTDAESRQRGNWWANWPLNRYFNLIAIIVLLCLALVLALAARQFFLYQQCQKAVIAADRLLFAYTAFKGHLNESLLLSQPVDFMPVNDELLYMGAQVKALTAHELVPAELRSSLPTRAELVALEVQLRTVSESSQDSRERTSLIRMLNGLNVELQQFRFHLSDYTQGILLGLHKTIVGALGLIVLLSCTLLYLLNRYLALPILQLCRLAAPQEHEDAEKICSFFTLKSRVSTIAAQLAALPTAAASENQQQGDTVAASACLYRYASSGFLSVDLASEQINHINGIMNYTQTLMDVGKRQGMAGEKQKLVQALHREEKKATDLLAAVQKLGQWQGSQAGQVSMQAVFSLLRKILAQPLRVESIRLDLPEECLVESRVARGDLWLVILSVLQLGRFNLNQHPSLPQHLSEKVLSLAVHLLDRDAQRLVLHCLNSSGMWSHSPAANVFPPLSFCAELLAVHGAGLSRQETGSGEIIVLDLPCRIAAT
ncbi:MAG: hypothetical protein GX087_03980 [Desulfobulbaceae bacterium]|nr:hypothetical protein [Desulfobulbaceae bacterium]